MLGSPAWASTPLGPGCLGLASPLPLFSPTGLALLSPQSGSSLGAQPGPGVLYPNLPWPEGMPPLAGGGGAAAVDSVARGMQRMAVQTPQQRRARRLQAPRPPRPGSAGGSAAAGSAAATLSSPDLSASVASAGALAAAAGSPGRAKRRRPSSAGEGDASSDEAAGLGDDAGGAGGAGADLASPGAGPAGGPAGESGEGEGLTVEYLEAQVGAGSRAAPLCLPCRPAAAAALAAGAALLERGRPSRLSPPTATTLHPPSAAPPLRATLISRCRPPPTSWAWA